MQRVRVGAVQVISLNDTTMPFPGSDVYPEAGALLERYSEHLDANGALPLPFQSFVLIDGDTTVLVDTGFGPEFNGVLPGELEAAGVAPGAIDVVTFTHLHVDHTGWNLDRETGQPNYQNARYLVPQKDWDHFGSGEHDSFERDIRPLDLLDRMTLFEGEHTVSPSVTAIPTPGHTPGHTSYIISSGGERGCILGDVVLSAIDAAEPHLKNGFDTDEAVARSTRQTMIERLVADGALVGASHIAVPGIGRFVMAEGRSFWQGATLG